MRAGQDKWCCCTAVAVTKKPERLVFPVPECTAAAESRYGSGPYSFDASTPGVQGANVQQATHKNDDLSSTASVRFFSTPSHSLAANFNPQSLSSALSRRNTNILQQRPLNHLITTTKQATCVTQLLLSSPLQAPCMLKAATLSPRSVSSLDIRR